MPKYSHGSVDRNRVKRRLRELVRLDLLRRLPAIDVVIKAAPRAYSRTFADLRDDIDRMARQLVKQFGEPPTPPAP